MVKEPRLCVQYTKIHPARELDANAESYMELLKGTGKKKEAISKDVQRPKYFQAHEAIDNALANEIIDPTNVAFEKRMLAQSKAMRKGASPQAAPSGFR